MNAKMEVERLQEMEREAYDKVLAMEAEHNPPIDAAKNTWHGIYRELQRAKLRLEIESEMAQDKGVA